jgi:hypothetical protein
MNQYTFTILDTTYVFEDISDHDTFVNMYQDLISQYLPTIITETEDGYLTLGLTYSKI